MVLPSIKMYLNYYLLYYRKLSNSTWKSHWSTEIKGSFPFQDFWNCQATALSTHTLKFMSSIEYLPLQNVLFNYTVPQHTGGQLLIAKMYYDVLLSFLKSEKNNTLYYRASIIVSVFIQFKNTKMKLEVHREY